MDSHFILIINIPAKYSIFLMQNQFSQRIMTLGHSIVGFLLRFFRDGFKLIRLPKWLTRQLWLKVHLLLALSVGFIFAILGFTGSLCVYREELDTLLNPQLVVEEAQGEYQSLDQIMASVRAAHPDRHGEWTLELPRSSKGMITAWFEKPRETYFERYAPLMVSVNPYTAEVVASRFWGQTLTTWLLDLHTQLQLDQAGWNIVGYCGLLLIVSVGSGLYLWWPGVKNIQATLKIDFSAGLMRLLFDCHRMLGVFSTAALLTLAVTGFNLSFPNILENLFSAKGMAHGETGRAFTSTAMPNDHPTLLEAAEFIARSPFPKAEVRRLTTPDGNSGVYRVNLRQRWEINQRHPYTTVWIDRWSGQIKEVRNPDAFSPGQTFMTWIWPLHTGEALGEFGRFCWFLAGLSLFFLYISGVIRWLHRSGKLQDRAIRLSRDANVKARVIKVIYQLLLTIDQLMNRLAATAAPYVKRLFMLVAHWLARGVRYYQSRDKK